MSKDEVHAHRLAAVNAYYSEYFPKAFTEAEMLKLISLDIDSPPPDALRPEWHKKSRVHNWRNYATEGLEEIWPTFTPLQKVILAHALQERADMEIWN
jgi:hypothetical protein